MYLYVKFCAIWYHLHNLRNVKNTHAGVLLLVKLQVLAQNVTYKFSKSNILKAPYIILDN